MPDSDPDGLIFFTCIQKHVKSSRHMTFIQHQINIDATSWICINLYLTWYLHHAPAGKILIECYSPYEPYTWRDRPRLLYQQLTPLRQRPEEKRWNIVWTSLWAWLVPEQPLQALPYFLGPTRNLHCCHGYCQYIATDKKHFISTTKYWYFFLFLYNTDFSGEIRTKPVVGQDRSPELALVNQIKKTS